MIKVPISEKIFLRAFKFVFYLGIASLVVFVSVYIMQGHVIWKGNLSFEKLSSFGDFIGGLVGTLFTIGATILIWLTYHSQKEELSKTNAIAELQTKNLKTQQFEGTYFLMAQELRSIPDSVSGSLPAFTITIHDEEEVLDIDMNGMLQESTYNGRKFFMHAAAVLMKYFPYKLQEMAVPVDQAYEQIPEIYFEFYTKYLDELDHYFRYFYNVLKFVDNSHIQNKKLYTDLLQAQLSKYELALRACWEFSCSKQ